MKNEVWKPLTKTDYMKRPAREEIWIHHWNQYDEGVKETIIVKPDENLECEYCPNKVFPNQDSVGYELFIDDEPYEIICEHCYRKEIRK